MPTSNRRPSPTKRNVVREFEDRLGSAVDRVIAQGEAMTDLEMMRSIARRLGCTLAELKPYKKLIKGMFVNAGWS